MSKILFVADAHSQTGKRAPDSRFALKQVNNLAVKHEADWLIFLGDTTDKQRNRSGPVIDVLACIREAARRDKKVGFIQGQHDWDDPPWFTGMTNTQHLHQKSFEVGGKLIYALDFLPEDQLQAALKEIPSGTHMFLAHQVWSEWMGDIAAPQGSFADVPHVKRIVTGDLHKHVIETHKNKQGQKMKVVSPGATYQKAINEPSEHFVVLWDSEEDAFEPLKLKSRPFVDWDVLLQTEDLEEFVAEIGGKLKETVESLPKGYPDDVKKPLLRVTYSAKIEGVARRIRRAVGDKAFLYEKELPPEEKLKREKSVAGNKHVAVTPLSELSKAVDKTAEPEVFNLLTRLLSTPDKERRQQEFTRFKAEFMQAGAAESDE